MSRSYNMNIQAVARSTEDASLVVKAVCEETRLDEDDFSIDIAADGHYVAYASEDLDLYGGRSEEDFVEDVLNAIYKSVSEYVDVTIHMTCLEDVPYETYESSEEEFERVKAEKEKSDESIPKS
jgi:hypothetical protein